MTQVPAGRDVQRDDVMPAGRDQSSLDEPRKQHEDGNDGGAATSRPVRGA